MIRFRRSAQAKSGNYQDALAFAHEVSDHINRTHGQSIQVFTEMFGNVSTFYWYSDHDSLADLEALNAQIVQDQQYWGIVNQASHLWIDGSIHDTVMRRA